jgi:phosphatidylglycerophosphatase A
MGKIIQTLCINGIVTVLGTGRMKFAPGTWGSLFGLSIFYLTHLPLIPFLKFDPVLYFPIYAVFILILLAVGTVATKHYIKTTKSQDPKEVVIDEVVGQLIASYGALLAFVLLEKTTYPGYPLQSMTHHYILYLVVMYPISFLLFRLFDIWKPLLVGWCDKNIKGAWGVMLDDCVAGVFAAIVGAAVAYVLFSLL